MLPLPLKWCMIGGTATGTIHLVVISIEKLQKNSVTFKDLNHFECNTKFKKIPFRIQIV